LPDRRLPQVGSIALRLAALVAACAFALAAIAQVRAVGICCGDDAYFAHVAKNLALGYGYASSVQLEDDAYRLKPFDPQVGSGPTLILPAAAAIEALGNRYWVPGVTHLLMEAALFGALFAMLRRRVDGNALAAAALALFGVAYATTVFSAELWSALLGEVPAALLVAVAVICWAIDPEDRRRLALASLLISLAALAKLLALLHVAVFLTAVSLAGLRRRGSWREAGRDAALAGAAALALPVAFEVWKLLALGVDGYFSHVQETIAFVRRHGEPDAGVGALLRITRKSHRLHDHYGFTIFELIAIGGGARVLAERSGRHWLRRASSVLLAGIVLQSTWWLLFSVPRERYMAIAVALFAVLTALGMLAAQGWRMRLGWAVLLAVFLLPNVGRLSFPLREASLFERSERLDHLLAAVGFLASRRGELALATPASPSVMDLEYLLPGVGNFERLSTLEPEAARRGYWLTVNALFVDEKHPSFTHALDRCGPPVLDLPPYRVFPCVAP
jgi:hypothetical protein